MKRLGAERFVLSSALRIVPLRKPIAVLRQRRSQRSTGTSIYSAYSMTATNWKCVTDSASSLHTTTPSRSKQSGKGGSRKLRLLLSEAAAGLDLPKSRSGLMLVGGYEKLLSNPWGLRSAGLM